MKFSFTRLSLLKFFILNKKRTKRTLLVINFSIFLTIFAATAAIISLYIENKINEKEFDLIVTQRSQNYMHQMRSMFPVFHKSIDSGLMFDRWANRFNLFMSGTVFGDKIISNRERFFYRTHALIGPTYDLFDDDWGIKDIEWTIDAIFLEEDKDSLNHKKIIEQYYYFEKKYKDFKKNTKDFEQYIAPSKSDLLNISEYSKDNIDMGEKYQDYYNFAWDLNIWAIDLIELLERVYLQLITIQKIEMKNLNEEIINLSKNESRIIFLAFIFQLIIFIIIQFFEISSLTAENTLKRKQK